MSQVVRVGARSSEHWKDVTRWHCGNIPRAAVLGQDWKDESRRPRKDCDKDERDDSGLAWSGGREWSRTSSIQLLVRLGRAVVRGLALDDGARAFEYKVPFGVMDTAQSWPFVVFKQIMIPTFQTI